MAFGRRVRTFENRYEADQELAGSYRAKLDEAAEAERELRAAQAEDRPEVEIRGLSKAFDKALLDALRAAEAAEGVAAGPKTYPASEDPQEIRRAQIARRKALAKPAVRPWTDEVDRLRTAREELKFSYRAVFRT
jgi:hypothetical protein